LRTQIQHRHYPLIWSVKMTEQRESGRAASVNGQSSQYVEHHQGRQPRAARKRRRVVLMCFGVLATAISITAVAVLAIMFSAVPPRVAEISTPSARANVVGTIVVHSGENGCQGRTFNNQTGQISDVQAPCHNETPLDAKGVPIPLGTVHTMNSISNSFKRGPSN